MLSRLLPLWLLWQATAPAVIERIVAVVEGRPLMLSQVRLAQRLRDLTEAAAREALIDEQLMFGEASRLPQAVVTADEEERGYQDLIARVPDAREHASEAELRAVVRRQLAILKYVEFRFRPQIRIADDAVREAYEQESAGRPPSDAPAYPERAPALRERLERRELDLRIEAWVRELRASALVRYNP